MKNILSIDLESVAHFYEDSLRLDKSARAHLEKKNIDNGYIPEATNIILDLLDEYNQKITFFIPAEIYDWYPGAIEEIGNRGHEIAYHTHSHTIIKNSNILENELTKSKNFINKFHPIGFRAPYIFITRDSMKILKNHGFQYSSSTYADHGMIKIDGIDEIPVSAIRFIGKEKVDANLTQNLTMSLFSKKIPVGSGLFIAMLGSNTSYVIDYLNRRKKPAIFFLHSWQIYKPKHLGCLRFKLRVLLRNPAFLPYTAGVYENFKNLLKKYQFVSFKKYHYEHR